MSQDEAHPRAGLRDDASCANPGVQAKAGTAVLLTGQWPVAKPYAVIVCKNPFKVTVCLPGDLSPLAYRLT